MSTPICGQCKQPMIARTVATGVSGAHPIQVLKCRMCDTRRCKCGHYVQDPFIRHCPQCRLDLFRSSP